MVVVFLFQNVARINNIMEINVYVNHNLHTDMVYVHNVQVIHHQVLINRDVFVKILIKHLILINSNVKTVSQTLHQIKIRCLVIVIMGIVAYMVLTIVSRYAIVIPKCIQGQHVYAKQYIF
jgi:hypothetical protein